MVTVEDRGCCEALGIDVVGNAAKQELLMVLGMLCTPRCCVGDARKNWTLALSGIRDAAKPGTLMVSGVP